jgi:hypothetical protein
MGSECERLSRAPITGLIAEPCKDRMSVKARTFLRRCAEDFTATRSTKKSISLAAAAWWMRNITLPVLLLFKSCLPKIDDQDYEVSYHNV